MAVIAYQSREMTVEQTSEETERVAFRSFSEDAERESTKEGGTGGMSHRKTHRR